MGEVSWSSEAERWLREIHDYIARDNPAAAFRTVQGIYKKAEVLEEYPEIGYVYRKQGPQTVRILLYGHYRIAYIIKASNEIDILGSSMVLWISTVISLERPVQDVVCARIVGSSCAASSF